MIKNIVISGYYGFDNFGDEAVLKTLINEIRKTAPDINITVITSNLQGTAETYNVNTVYTFDLFGIFKTIKKTDLFISGGGSVLQDVTSLKSLFYYLLLIFTAGFFGKKVAIIAQGIGPVNTFIGKIFTKNVLKKVDLITVRDKKSHELLEKWSIKSYLTADLIWTLDYSGNALSKDSNGSPEGKDWKHSRWLCHKKLSVGIQLRGWKKMDDKKIKSLAKSLKSSFNLSDIEFNVIAFQPKEDIEICRKFCTVLKQEINDVDVNLICLNNIDKNIELISSLDYLIAMRFHAGLIAIREQIPTLMLSYDPKVENLCTNANINYVNVDQINDKILYEKLKKIQEDNFVLKQQMKIFSSKMAEISRQNIDLLIKNLKN